MKCLRERRECVFTAERSTKKRKFSFLDGNSLQSGQHQHQHQHQHSNSTTSVSSPVKQEVVSQVARANGNHRPDHQPRGGTASEAYETDVVHTVVSSSHDALGLLFKAVEQQEADDGRARSAPDSNGDDSPATISSIRGLPITPSNLIASAPGVLSLWKQHRFVKQGWLSPSEAASYVEL